jgi:hypothetical protein
VGVDHAGNICGLGPDVIEIHYFWGKMLAAVSATFRFGGSNQPTVLINKQPTAICDSSELTAPILLHPIPMQPVDI